jgi:prepilin-type N-terminal cleavage/methylation domain-containing protein
LLKSFRRFRKKGFTLVELLVVVAILAILTVALLPSVLGYSDKARDARAIKDVRNFATVIETFTATDGDYPEASLDTDNPRSIASVMQSKGINWTGDETGIVDPWNNPYYYDLTEDYYCIASSGKDGTLNTSDDICNISGKASKKASGLDENAIPSAVPGNNPGGGGPEHQAEVPDGYIGIYTPEQLASIGNDEDYPLDGDYIVMANISLSGYVDWAPIGKNIASPFTGTFNGNNYVISNLTINSNQDHKGLFGCISKTSKITNLGLENANINVAGGNYVGGLVGYTSTGCTIENCYATGKVTGGSDTGGLVGRNYGTITDCYATAEVTGGSRTGGLVGYAYSGSITSCYATGKVTGDSCTGGLVGWNNGAIENCYTTGNVNGVDRTGGLVGLDFTGCTIENSYYNSETTGQSGRGTPLTTEEMKDQSNFSGWDFDTVWGIDEGFSYPYLQTNEQIPHPGI